MENLAGCSSLSPSGLVKDAVLRITGPFFGVFNPLLLRNRIYRFVSLT